jgi:hypothetical protein
VSDVRAGVDREGRDLLVRVRRPRVRRDLINDSRLAAGAAGALQRATEVAARGGPGSGAAGAAVGAAGLGMGPVGFVQLVLRQNLESTDLRFDALDLVELGIVLERGGHDGMVVARPVTGGIDARALAVGAVRGTPLGGPTAVADPAAATRALVAVTLESAIVDGVFWADPAVEHLLVTDEGQLVLVGVGTLGRFTPELRLAGVRFLKAVLTGDFEGMVDGLRIAGAVPADIDVAALLADLRGSDRLDPAKILFGGEGAFTDALSATVGILLRNRLAPPVEVILLLRTVYALGELLHRVDPGGGGGLTAALLPLLPRLPEIIAAAESAVDPTA